MTIVGDPPDNHPAKVPGLASVHVQVNGTTVMAEYEVVGDILLLTSVDFGDASAALDGQTAEAVAERLLQEIAESEMSRSGVHYMRDDEANPHDA